MSLDLEYVLDLDGLISFKQSHNPYSAVLDHFVGMIDHAYDIADEDPDDGIERDDFIDPDLANDVFWADYVESGAAAVVNDPPVAEDDAFETDYMTAITMDLLDNDTDTDGDALSINNFDNLLADEGTLALDEEGNMVFTPAEGFEGTVTFDYTVFDGVNGYDTATVTIDVAPEVTVDYYIQTVSGDGTLDADAIRADQGMDHVYFEFDAPPAENGLVTIQNFDMGDSLVTGFDLEENLYIEGVGAATVNITFGDDVEIFDGVWSVNLAGQDEALVDELQAEAGDLAAQIETLGVALGEDWIMEMIAA